MEENKIIVSPKQYLQREDVKQKFAEILGNRSTAFLSSVLTIVSQNKMLEKARPDSIYMAAMMAATLDLPINQNLNYAYIIPYSSKTENGYEQVAQFQIGYKGIIQLAQRSGQFKTINTSDVKEGEIKHFNRLTGEIDFEWMDNRDGIKTIGFVAYFELLNGFKKSLYMTVDELKEHGLKYSKAYANEKTKRYSLWETSFFQMASKTVCKLLLSRYAPLSVQMERGFVSDQAIIKDADTLDVVYIDNKTDSIEEINDKKESDRVIEFINSAKTKKELMQVAETVEIHGLQIQYDQKMSTLKT